MTIETITLGVGIATTAAMLLTIAAMFWSPIVALKVQKETESFNEKNNRKLDIFKTLLATRANTLAFEHVKALNMIDFEFYKHKDIREAWNLYRDHLYSPYPPNENKAAQEIWENNRIGYCTDLLHIMSKFFGYDFDKVMLKKGAYHPIAHGILELEQRYVRSAFIKLLDGNKVHPLVKTIF